MSARRAIALLLALLLLTGPTSAAAGPDGDEPPAMEQETLTPAPAPIPPESSAPDTEPPAQAPEDPADTEPPAERATASNAGELTAWMRSLGPEGGEIFLEDTVTLTWEDSAYFGANLEAPTVIHTGAYGLVYDGKGIRVIGQEIGMFQIEGEGVEIPVLELRGDQFFGSDWNEILAYQEVTASGRDGRGGVAVHVTSDSEVRSNLEYYETRGRIHAYGAGAVGLELDVPALVNCLDIDVSGEGSLAIDGPEGTAAFLCKLTAGEGGSPAGAGVNTDSSVLNSETAGPRIDYRVGIEPQIPQGADAYKVWSAVGLDYVQRYRLTDGNYIDVDLIYDEDFAEAIDTSVLGPVDIPVALPKPLQGLGLEGENGLAFRARVRDPALPILSEMWQWWGTLTFSTWDGDPWDPETRLWRSDDGGVTWVDAMGWEAMTWIVEEDSYDVFQLDASGVDHPISLALKNRAGWGNVVTLTPGEDGTVDPGTGSDRDGGDREELPGGGGGEHDGGTPDDGPGDPSPDEPSGPAGDGTGGGSSSGGGTDSNPPVEEPSGDNPPPASDTEPGPQPGAGDGTPPGQEGERDAGESRAPWKPLTDGILIFPWLELTRTEAAPAEPPADSPPPAAPSAAPGGAREAPSTAAPASGQAPAAQDDPARPELETAPVTPPPSSAPASAAPEPDAETPPPGPVQPSRAKPSHGGGLALPVLVLFAAGGLTALVTLWKKRSGR